MSINEPISIVAIPSSIWFVDIIACGAYLFRGFFDDISNLLTCQPWISFKN